MTDQYIISTSTLLSVLDDKVGGDYLLGLVSKELDRRGEEILVALGEPPERITKVDTGELVCLCGNEPAMDGFSPCMPDGFEVEPTCTGPWQGRLYVCLKCNRIVDQETLEVVGHRSELIEALSCADGCDTCWYLCTIGPESAEEEFGEEMVNAKLHAHLESGHKLNSDEVLRGQVRGLRASAATVAA